MFSLNLLLVLALFLSVAINFEKCSGYPATDVDIGRLGHEDALEDLGEVPEVEGVVRLGRRGQQLVLDGVVGRDARIHQAVTQRALVRVLV